MLLRIFLILAVGVVLAQPVSLRAEPWHSTNTQTPTSRGLRYAEHQGPTSGDPISGDWDLAFQVQGSTTPATFNLKLEGEKVTGKVYSAHTGAGTINGSWVNNKLSMKMDFKAHESIELSGELKDGQMAGEFRTEGFVSKWQAKKKTAQAAASAGTSTAAPQDAASADPISGEWEASLQAQGTGAPIKFKFKLEGEKVTGVSESEHLGSGSLNDGIWKANKLSFTVNGNFGVIALSGELHDGKLVGVWNLTGKDMKGSWEAKKK
jgi:hypothetical protein